MLFPEVLFQILSDESNADTVAWQPSGIIFSIQNRNKFVSETLPKYFGDEIKFTSFTRKLKRWGFIRVPTDDGGVAFFNKHFRSENAASIKEMRPQQTGSVPTIPMVAFSLCRLKSTKNSPREVPLGKIMVNNHCGSKPLKKRPVDESCLHMKRHAKVLPEPKLITVVKHTPPSSLQSCHPADIERQGLARQIQRTCTYKNDVKPEALFKLMLQRQLLREGQKAKQHFKFHHGGNQMAKSALICRRQEELHRHEHPPSPMQRDPVRDLLQACKWSSLSSSLVLANECPIRKTSSCIPRYSTTSLTTHPQPSKNGRIVYDYAHAA